MGGGAVGAGAHLAGLWTIQGLFGRDLSPIAGGFEGLVLGGPPASATPSRRRGPKAGWPPRADGHGRGPVLATGLCCAVAAVALAATGSYLGAMSLDFMAHAFPGSQVGLAPLSRLLGEAEPGLVTRARDQRRGGAALRRGLALGLTRRPRSALS